MPAGTVGYLRTTQLDATSVVTVGEQAFAENHRWRHATNLVADAREAAQTANVTMRYEDPERDLTKELSATDAIYFYALDWAAYTQLTDELAQHQAQVTSFDAGHVVADYAADKSGWLMVSLPQEKGWSATVNGTPVELSSAYEGALMLVPVVAGSNHVELKFMPPGLVIGCAVSGVSLLLAAFVGISRRAQMAVLH